MAKGTVTVRLPEETLEAFKNEAKAEGKTISEIVVEAILAGRESKQPIIQAESETPEVAAPGPDDANESHPEPTLNDIMFRIASLENYLLGNMSALGDLSLRVARSAAAAHYYARMNAKYSLDISSLVATNKPLDSKSRKQQFQTWTEKCKQFEQQVLTMPYEDLIQAKFIE